MKSKIILFLTIFLLFAKSISAQEAVKDYAFKAGEKCQFDLYYNWGFIWINAARTNLTVNDTTYDGKSAFELRMETSTIKTFSIFNFKDTTTTYVNKKTLLPYYSRQASFEPDYFTIDHLTFFKNDTVKWGAFIEKERKKGNRSDTIYMQEQPYYDLLTTVFRMRNINVNTLVESERISLPIILGDKTYDLYMRYDGKDQIKLKSGKTYNCLKIKPSLIDSKLFEKGEGMTIWISDDDNHIPLMIESKLKIGSLKAMLRSVENTRHPMTSEVEKKK